MNVGVVILRKKREKSRYPEAIKMVLDVLPYTEKDFKSSGKAGELLYEAVGFWKDIDLCQLVKIYMVGSDIKVGYAEGSKVVSSIFDSNCLQETVYLKGSKNPDWLDGDWRVLFERVIFVLKKKNIPTKDISIVSTSNMGVYVPYKHSNGEYSFIFF